MQEEQRAGAAGRIVDSLALAFGLVDADGRTSLLMATIPNVFRKVWMSLNRAVDSLRTDERDQKRANALSPSTLAV